MWVTHEPPGYVCPFYKLAAGSDGSHNCQDDIVRRTFDAMALISPRVWPRNHGHVLVVPARQYENLYQLPARAEHERRMNRA
jgi:histidine triad (HIT) family protein